MLLLAGKQALAKHHLTPKARIVAYATESRHPDNFPDAPIGAIEKVCAKAGLSLNDIDLFEINEAFALVTLLAIKGLKSAGGKGQRQWRCLCHRPSDRRQRCPSGLDGCPGTA